MLRAENAQATQAGCNGLSNIWKVLKSKFLLHRLCGYWQFYASSNEGFYMAPKVDTIFNISCENGYEGQLSADALGIGACLYAFSHRSFREDEFAAICAQHCHWLGEHMMEHAEARAILGVID